MCLGQSTFLRFNHPAEAKWMKSMIPAGGRAPGPPYSPGSGRDGQLGQGIGLVVLLDNPPPHPFQPRSRCQGRTMSMIWACCHLPLATGGECQAVWPLGQIQEVLLGWNRGIMCPRDRELCQPHCPGRCHLSVWDPNPLVSPPANFTLDGGLRGRKEALGLTPASADGSHLLVIGSSGPPPPRDYAS